MKRGEKLLCNNCRQPYHGQTNCDDAAGTRVKALIKEAHELRTALTAVEQQLYDLNYEHFCYITGVIKRKSETHAETDKA